MKDNDNCTYSGLIIKYANWLSTIPLFKLNRNFLGPNILGFFDNAYKCKSVNRC